MRISERHKYNLTSSRVENAKDLNNRMLEEMSTQKTINHLSDKPIELAQVIRQNKQVSQTQQFKKSIDYAKGFLERSESASSGMTNFLIRAKELAVSMSNGTYGPDSRNAAGREINEIMDAITSLANTTYGNRYIFGGFRSQTPPLSRDGVYLGDDGGIFIQVGEQDYKQINLQSRNLFESNNEERALGHFNMMDTLNILYRGMLDNDIPQIRIAMDDLDFQLDKVSTYQAKVGAVFNSLENIYGQLVVGEEGIRSRISELEDTARFKASSDFKRTEQILQSTLMASNKLLQPSLLNFLQ